MQGIFKWIFVAPGIFAARFINLHWDFADAIDKRRNFQPKYETTDAPYASSRSICWIINLVSITKCWKLARHDVVTAPGTIARQSTILVVDDDAVSRMMLCFYISKSAQHPIDADSASEARKLIAELGPSAVDCVVTDYNMPEESGLELLLWIKQADPTLSVVMITATTERETVTSTLRSGASDFLDKPISPDKLKEAVNSGIALTTQRRRLA